MPTLAPLPFLVPVLPSTQGDLALYRSPVCWVPEAVKLDMQFDWILPDLNLPALELHYLKPTVPVFIKLLEVRAHRFMLPTALALHD